MKGYQDRGRKKDGDGSYKGNTISKFRNQNKKNVECYKCNHMSQFKKDCPNEKQDNERKDDGPSNSANVVEGDSDCTNGGMLFFSAGNSDKLHDSWVFDSTC